MKELKHQTETLTHHITEYIDTYLKLSVVQATDKTANAASASVLGILIAVLAIFTLLFFGIGLGYWLGEQLENMLAGFGIVAGFFALLIILVIALRKSFFVPVFRNFIIRSVYG